MEGGDLFIEYLEKKNITLKIAIIQNKIKDIGKIKPETREFNLNADRKRFWLGRIESMDDGVMNESFPISANYFKKEFL